jgi:hypothetical protein
MNSILNTLGYIFGLTVNIIQTVLGIIWKLLKTFVKGFLIGYIATSLYRAVFKR